MAPILISFKITIFLHVLVALYLYTLFLGIEFDQSTASFLKMEMECHKIITMPIRPIHLDQAIAFTSTLEMHSLLLTPANNETSISGALSRASNFKLNFSSDDIKNGRKFVCVFIVSIIVCSHFMI